MLVVILTFVNTVPIIASSKNIETQIQEAFTVNSIDASTTTITGRGLAGAEVSAFVGEKQIGKTVTVNSKQDYSINIKAQFAQAQAFTNGHALVALNGYNSAIIDKKGNNKTKGIYLKRNLLNYSHVQPEVGEGLFGRYDPMGEYVFADIDNPSKIKVHRGK